MSKLNTESHQQNAGIDFTRPSLEPRHWPEEFVIGGIGGRFPESDSFEELKQNLLSNIDLVTCDDRRWPVGLNDNEASRSGKLKSLALFDNVYFCTLPILVQHMDPGSRIILETVYEAIADAGWAPQALRGSNTGVYVGINTVANAEAIPQDDFSDVLAKNAAFWVYGTSKALLANRISFLFDFIGPSTVIDTACSSSLVALSNALNDLRSGVCDHAIVATANLCSAPYSSHVYSALGLLAKDGKCKVFDKDANGFVRSESVCAIFLTARSTARRIYATLLNARTNTDGFKTVGLFAPFWLRQRNLMIETYQEAGVKPEQIGFIEAHGTGTMVGDPQEARAISEAYCVERSDKLLVGAVKSNMGHTEGASGLSSVAKALIAFETGTIPANLHYTSPKPEIDVLHRTIEPVVRNTSFDGDFIGVNSFGVGGVNAHVLLGRNSKLPGPEAENICDPIPRLVSVCGRTQEAVEHVFDFIKQNPKAANRDFLALLNESMKTTSVRGSANFQYRGYQLIWKSSPDSKNDNETGESLNSCRTNATTTEIAQYTYEQSIIHMPKRPEELWLVFSGMGSQWLGMGGAMMRGLGGFRKSIQECSRALERANIELDLVELLSSTDESSSKESEQQPEVAFVLITAMQIALYDMIQELNLPISGFVGHSFGEIACAYADGVLTAQEAILTSYWRGKVVAHGCQQGHLASGRMAAVGMSLGMALERCSNANVHVACHNGTDSVTISGRIEPMERFCSELEAEGVFVRPVVGGLFPYHSEEMAPVCDEYIQKLESIISAPKRRSEKWISSSIEPDDDPSKGLASALYFVNNLRTMVRFDQAMSAVPKGALCIEIAPHSLFKSIFARCFKDLTYVGLMNRGMEDLKPFLRAVGDIYSAGFNPATESLYPVFEWPVARGTASIGHLLKWDHSEEHFVPKYPEAHNFATAANYNFTISCMDPDWRFLKDHAINGKIVFPATGLLWIVWRALATKHGQPWHKTPIRLESIRICRPTLLTETSNIKFTVQILDKNGEFLLTEMGNVVCTGKAFIPEAGNTLELQTELEEQFENFQFDPETTMEKREIYKELRIRGYDYGTSFQGLQKATQDGKSGIVQWTGNWISFVDSALHISLLSLPIRTLFVPIGIELFTCNPLVLYEAISQAKDVKNIDSTVDSANGKVDLNREHLENEFCYFSDMARRSEILGQGTEEIKEIVKADDAAMGVEIVNFDIRQEDAKVAEKKTVQFNVKFDFYNQMLITTGIEVRGMLPVNVPRNISSSADALIIERHRFVPFDERRHFDTDSRELQFYIERCTQLTTQLAQKFCLQLPQNGASLEQSDSGLEAFLPLRSASNPEFFYYQTLNDALTNAENAGQLAQIDWRSVHEDLLFDGLLKVETFYRPFMEVIAENLCSQSSVKVLEINPHEKLLGLKVCKLLKANVIHKFEVDYNAGQHPELHEESADTKIKFHHWASLDSFDWLDSFEDEFDLIIVKRSDRIDSVLTDRSQASKISRSLKSNGFLLAIGRTELTPFERNLHTIFPSLSLNDKIVTSESSLCFSDLSTIGERYDQTTCTKLNLLRKSLDVESFRKLIRIVQLKDEHILDVAGKGEKFEWIYSIKEELEKIEQEGEPDLRVWLLSNAMHSGILGFFNALKFEKTFKLRVLINQTGRPISPESLFADSTLSQRLMCLDLSVVVLRPSDIAGSYHFVAIKESEQTLLTEWSYLSQKQRGDLSSLQWYQSEFDTLKQTHPFCDVYFSALNFKDVVLAAGKIAPGPESALFDCILGLEFSGRRRDDAAHTRVMGMLPFKGIATVVPVHGEQFLWNVPDHWSLEEAATIPVVYITVIYALIIRARIQANDSLLIHSAAGGVGQAALHLALSKLSTPTDKIFVTVGTEEKRNFVHTHFGIPLEHIFSSRDIAFERKIKSLTKGRGVDVVLNSLTGEKLQASLRCVAANGRFLEIGKLDLQMNSNLGMFCFLNNITFHGVGIDAFFREGFGSGRLEEFMKEIGEHLRAGIEEGFVKPIQRTVFQHTETEKAFRYMASGQHIGKVIIQMRQETEVGVAGPVMRALCKAWFHPDKVYIIAGGLGGVGLELLYWMVLQGARKFVVTSRSGVKTAFQRVFLSRFRMIEQFCSQYKIEIDIVRENISDLSGAAAVLERAKQCGQQIGGVFNLTLVLEDGLFDKQTHATFANVCDPKAIGTANLDRLLRESLDYELDHFVVFSSFSSGRGNAGQTNYSYANSVMERIIERRNEDGLAGIAIQFGPIGDVGIVAEQFLRAQKEAEDAEKQKFTKECLKNTEPETTNQEKGEDDEENKDAAEKTTAEPVKPNNTTTEDAIRYVLGLELQRINSCLDVLDRLLPLRMGIYSSYVKFIKASSTSGGDSEVIRQLCAYLNIDKRADDDCLGDIGLDSISAIEIQQRLENDFGISITLDDVRKITVKELKNFRDGDRHNLKQYSEDIEKARRNLSRICFTIPTLDSVDLNDEKENAEPLYALPPLQGVFDWIQAAVNKLKRPVIGLNWTRKTTQQCQTLTSVVEYYQDVLEELIKNQDGLKQNKDGPCVDLLVTAFGALIVCLLARKGSLFGRIRNLILLDLWPVELEDMTDESKLSDYKVRLMFANIGTFIPARICQQSLKDILSLNCERERIAKTIELMRKCVGAELRGADLTEIVTNSYFRAELMLRYHFKKLRKSKSSLKQELLKVLSRNDELVVQCIRLDKIPSTEDNGPLKRGGGNAGGSGGVAPAASTSDGDKKRKLMTMFDLEDGEWGTVEQHIKARVHLHSIRGTQEEVTTGKLDEKIEELLKKIAI